MQNIWQDIVQQKFVGTLTLDVIFFRLLLAVIFGGIVGLERERRHRPAGFRTHILVCFGAAIVSMVQDQLRIEILSYSADGVGFAQYIKTDLGRLGAQVISGIGFLGAGCIIKDRGDIVMGMTTAAGIWATGCVGLGIGWGFYNIAVVAIIFMVIVMVVMKKMERKIIKTTHSIHFEVRVLQEDLGATIHEYHLIFGEENVEMEELKKENEIVIMKLLVYIDDTKDNIINISNKISNNEYLRDKEYKMIF